MLTELAEAAVAGGAALYAYRNKVNPKSRIETVCKTLEKTKDMSMQNLEMMSELTPDQRQVQDAKDLHRAVFNTSMDANCMQADLRNASFFREFMPNYVCSDPANPGGPKLVLSKIEENAYAQEQDIVKTSMQMKAIREARNPQCSQRQPNQYSQPRSSFDVDLEHGMHVPEV